MAKPSRNIGTTIFENKEPKWHNKKTWFQGAYEEGTPTDTEEQWQLRKSDIAEAICLSGNTAPGPDGIPYKVWRQLGQVAVDPLHEAGPQMEQGVDVFEHHERFNHATPCCVPKKADL